MITTLTFVALLAAVLSYNILVLVGARPYRPSVFDNLPSIYTSIGITGTFVGILLGLQGFDVNEIDASLPVLLEGLKTAFYTSIAGIALGLVMGTFNRVYGPRFDADRHGGEESREAELLTRLDATIARGFGGLGADMSGALSSGFGSLLHELRDDQRRGFEQLARALGSDADGSLGAQLTALRQTVREELGGATRELREAIGGNGETSLLTQVQRMREEAADAKREASAAYDRQLSAITGEHDRSLVTQLNLLREEQLTHNQSFGAQLQSFGTQLETNGALMARKFDEFAELMRKANTEALVQVMQDAMHLFNAQMKELFERLVKENFEELNRSVDRLNAWQRDNKEMIAQLTAQYGAAVTGFRESEQHIRNITEQNRQLTADDGKLQTLIAELRAVMVDDRKFTAITEGLRAATEAVEAGTERWGESTEQLRTWLRKQRDFTEATDKVLERFAEIERIKDINDAFWGDVKRRLAEGTDAVAEGHETLARSLSSVEERLALGIDKIDDHFVAKLDQLLGNLDGVMVSALDKYSSN